jgi:DNA-binding GntR family transcriptional regulator
VQAVHFDALKTSQVTDEVYDLLREKIVSCQLAPGERLAVDEIAAQLGVSRTPVKDALGRLAGDGLIEIAPRRGTFVTQLTPEDVREVFEVREALEIKACESLHGKIDASKAAHLREINQQLGDSGADSSESARLDARFHRMLVEYCGNRRIAEVYAQMNAHLQMALLRYRSDNWTARVLVVRDEHLAILEALEAGRIGRAKVLLRKHIRASLQRVTTGRGLSSNEADRIDGRLNPAT